MSSLIEQEANFAKVEVVYHYLGYPWEVALVYSDYLGYYLLWKASLVVFGPCLALSKSTRTPPRMAAVMSPSQVMMTWMQSSESNIPSAEGIDPSQEEEVEMMGYTLEVVYPPPLSGPFEYP